MIHTMVYIPWYIPIQSWYIPSKSGIYHEAAQLLPGSKAAPSPSPSPTLNAKVALAAPPARSAVESQLLPRVRVPRSQVYQINFKINSTST